MRYHEDIVTADNFYEMIKRADEGDTMAQYFTAFYILNQMERSDYDKDIIDRAFSYLRAAAMSSYFRGVAAIDLGGFFHSGQYVEQDFKKAVMWYRTAAQSQNPIGYYCLGQCFYRGHGVELNHAKAYDNFFKGTMKGFNINSVVASDMFKNGEFVEKDMQFAATLYKRVYEEELGFFAINDFYSDTYGQVCLRLGECYLHGIGVAPDTEKANFYFKEAKVQHTDNEYIDTTSTAEVPDLVELMEGAPYDECAKNEAQAIYISDDEYISLIAQKFNELKLDCDAENNPKKIEDFNSQESLEAYKLISKALLINDKKLSVNPYMTLAILYPRLVCVEQDQGFIDYCNKTSEKWNVDMTIEDCEASG